MTESVLVHTRVHVVGVEFARNFGRYGVRGERAYTHTQNPSGTDPFIKRPNLWYVLGVDRDIIEDLNVNVQAYQRIIINYRDPLCLDAVFNQQLDRNQQGFTGRV